VLSLLLEMAVLSQVRFSPHPLYNDEPVNLSTVNSVFRGMQSVVTLLLSCSVQLFIGVILLV